MRRALACAAVCFLAANHGLTFALPSSDLSKHAYGHLVVEGAIEGFELFRAAFGSLLPCGTYPLIAARDSFFCGNETGDISGKLVLARRGNCSFFDKAVRALEGGAAGLVIVNNQPGLLRVSAGNLTANYSRPIDIPIVMIKLASAPFLDHAFRFVDAVPASLVPYREPCVPPRRPTPAPPSPAHGTGSDAGAGEGADGSAPPSGQTGSDGASTISAEAAAAGAAGAGANSADALAASSGAPAPYRDDDFDRTVLAALLDERRAYAGDSLDIDALHSDRGGADAHAAAAAASAGAAGAAGADVAAEALVQMRVSETADVVLSFPGLGQQADSDADSDSDSDSDGDGVDDDGMATASSDASEPAGFAASASAEEMRLLQSLLASPASEGVAAFFSGPMLRPAVLPLAFADPLDACAPAEEVFEEDREEEVVEERDATPEEAAAAAAAEAAAVAANASASSAEATVSAASGEAAPSSPLAASPSAQPLRINVTKRVTVRVNVTKRTSHYAALAGRYAIAYRGGCPMIDKARQVEAAGAAGLIIVNTGADPATPPSLVDLQEEASRLWRCRFGGLCFDPPLLDASAADGNGIVPAPGSLQAAGGVPGATQAIADDAVKERPVRLSVVMVTALTAARWRWTDPASGQVRTIADVGARLQLRPRAARGDHWDTLAEDLPALFAVAAQGSRPGVGAPPAAPATGGAPGAARGAAAVAAARRAAAATPGAALSLPADHGARQQLLLRLLYRHHPESEQGHTERWALVQHAVRLADKALGRGSLVATTSSAAATSAGSDVDAAAAFASGWTFEEELEELQDASEWREGVDPSGPKFLGRERSASTPVETASPTAAFLTAHVPLNRLDRGLYDGGSSGSGSDGMSALLACGADEGSSFLLRHARLDLKATSRVLVRRVADLLQQQACLEKWLITSGARLGTYLALFRREASDDEWARMGAALLRPFGIPATSARSTFAAYIELAAQYELRPRPGDVLPALSSSSSSSPSSEAQAQQAQQDGAAAHDVEAAAAAEAADAAAAEAVDAVDPDTATVADWIAGRVRGGHARVAANAKRRRQQRRGSRSNRSRSGRAADSESAAKRQGGA